MDAFNYLAVLISIFILSYVGLLFRDLQ